MLVYQRVFRIPYNMTFGFYQESFETNGHGYGADLLTPEKTLIGLHEIKLEVEGPFVHQSGTIHTLSVLVFVWENSISLTICRRPM